MLPKLVAAAEEAVTELPIPPVAYGILAISALVFLLLFTFAFRNAGTKH